MFVIVACATITGMSQRTAVPRRRFMDRHLVSRHNVINASLGVAFTIFWVLFGKGLG